MKIKRVYEKKSEIDEYYLVIQVAGDEEYIIEPDDKGYEVNYDKYDINSVIDFFIEAGNDYGEIKIQKITVENFTNEKLQMLINAKKYNL